LAVATHFAVAWADGAENILIKAAPTAAALATTKKIARNNMLLKLPVW
jgi:hypothetical protein